jgi:hypothetical protein
VNFTLQNLTLKLPKVLVAIVVTIIFCNPVYAIELSRLDGRLKSSQSIKTVMVSIGARPYDFIKKFPQYNCSYSSNDSAKITELLKSFDEFKAKQVPENEVFIPIVEIEIHFIFRDGKEDVLYLGKQYLDESKIDGELIVDGKEASSFLLVNLGLSNQLLSWAQAADDVIPNKYINKVNQITECKDMASGKYFKDLLGPGAKACARRNMLLTPESEMCYLK